MNQIDETEDSYVIIVGGGIIGLAIAWRLARHGHAVTVIERDVTGEGASRVAAGMLAPQAEYGFQEKDLLDFGLASLERYPVFLDELEVDSGMRVAFNTRGVLLAGLDRDDNERIRRMFDFRRETGLPVEWLGATAARDIEPALSPRVTSAIWLPGDGQVDNRSLLVALRRAFEKNGGSIKEGVLVTEIMSDSGRCSGVRSAAGDFAATHVVLCAGSYSGTIDGVPAPLPVRPVKGQALLLKNTAACALTHVARSPRIYVVPKDDGCIFVGASQEEMGFDTTATAGPIMELLQNAWELVPSIYDLPVHAIETGLRPGTRDNRPLIGATGLGGLLYATGHFRHGILHTPITALAIEELITRGQTSLLPDSVLPTRFSRDTTDIKQTGTT